MRKTNKFRFAFGQPICVSDGDDDDDDAKKKKDDEPKYVTADQLHKALTTHQRRFMKGLKDELGDMGFVTSGDLDSALEKLVGDEVVDDDVPTDPPKKDDDDKPNDADLPSGVAAQLKRMEAETKRLRERADNAEKASKDKDTEVAVADANRAVEKLLSDAGARDPRAVRLAHIDPFVVEDEELGRAIPVKLTGGGEDFVSISDHIPTLKEEHDYLFETEEGDGKSGSGAGRGEGRRGKTRVTAEQLASPDKGGMSWDDYEKNKKDIFQDLEEGRKGK